MASEKLKNLFETMVEIYVKCVRHTIALRLAEAWADKPGGWYAYFKEVDAKNTANAGGKVEDISAHINSIYEFDFQACNKTMSYLGEVREVVYQAADVSKPLRSKINPYYIQLINFRNDYIGHENYTDDQKSATFENRDKAVEKMHLILQNAFQDTVDVESAGGNTYFHQFESVRLQYVQEHKTKAYYLAEHLDLTKYDAMKFLPVCKKLGIDTDVVDDRYIFYTYDLEGTLELLRNFMAMHGDGQNAVKPVSASAVAPVAQKTNKKGLRYLVVAVAVLVSLGVLGAILSAISGAFRTVSSAFDRFYGSESVDTAGNDALAGVASALQGLSGEEAEDKVTNPTTAQPSAIESAASQSTNEIPAEYEQKVKALMYSEQNRLELMTLEVKIGGYTSPREAGTWGRGTIYSQNTAVAVGEELLIKGVSPGETYIAYECNGLYVVYRIIVTD